MQSAPPGRGCVRCSLERCAPAILIERLTRWQGKSVGRVAAESALRRLRWLVRTGVTVHGVALGLEHLHAHPHDGGLVVDDDDRHALARRRSSARSLYSTESTRASQEASMMLSATPTVPHVSCASPEVISTRVLAAVPFDSSRMRTL